MQRQPCLTNLRLKLVRKLALSPDIAHLLSIVSAPNRPPCLSGQGKDGIDRRDAYPKPLQILKRLAFLRLTSWCMRLGNGRAEMPRGGDLVGTIGNRSH